MRGPVGGARCPLHGHLPHREGHHHLPPLLPDHPHLRSCHRGIKNTQPILIIIPHLFQPRLKVYSIPICSSWKEIQQKFCGTFLHISFWEFPFGNKRNTCCRIGEIYCSPERKSPAMLVDWGNNPSNFLPKCSITPPPSLHYLLSIFCGAK